MTDINLKSCTAKMAQALLRRNELASYIQKCMGPTRR
jgi:hypothetical protein